METENTFLQQYDKSQFESPIFSIDAALFTYHQQALKVLLVKRANHPDIGQWGLPGGFVELHTDQNLEDTVRRKLKEKTGVFPPYLEQLKTYGNSLRDKRGWSVTACYTALIAHQDCEPHIADVSDAMWLDVSELNTIKTAFDHEQIINDARQRLKQKALYSLIPAYALPQKFTLSELQHLHEELIGKSIQKKSFRRRVAQADILVEVGELKVAGGRPAKLYQIKEKSEGFTFLRNLEA